MGVFRVSLVLYLNLATLAGPWYCCCTLASALRSARPAEPEEDVAEEPTPPCCCCCPKPASAPQNQTEQTPDQPEAPPPPLCPCHEQQRNTFALVTLPSGLSAQSQALAALDAVDLTAFSCDADSLLRPAQPRAGDHLDLPALSGRDIRCACHILRC
ncbi:MAG: hypothetical protein L0Z62_43355 [Gemmataceae bacterium]|nr:hypothetical protein [Gemmataceae bacterium]